MSEKEKNALEERKNTALAVMTFEDDASAGFEDADSEAFAIPFLAILQSGSPQVKKSDGAYVKGAEEGMIFNTVNSSLAPSEDGITVIPVHYRRAYVEWVPLKRGGGFVSEIDVDDPRLKTLRRNEDGKDELENGNEAVDTRYHYVLIVQPDGAFTPAVIAMSSTQVKKSKKWMSVMSEFKLKRSSDGSPYTPPMFSHMFKLNTVPESNDKGSWYGWNVTHLRQLGDDEAHLYAAAKSFRDALKSGKVREATETLDSTSGTAEPGF